LANLILKIEDLPTETIKYEFWVGLFLLLGIAALVFLGLRVANVQGFGETKSYTVTATFDNIGGLKVRAPLKLGGVVIGRVSDITLDEKSYLPKVSIAINEEYKEILLKRIEKISKKKILINAGFDFDSGDFPLERYNVYQRIFYLISL